VGLHIDLGNVHSFIQSDSDLSVLDDEPPKKTKKQKTTKAKDKVKSIFCGRRDRPNFPQSGDKSKVSKGSKASSSLSKDEETIKRLKACFLFRSVTSELSSFSPWSLPAVFDEYGRKYSRTLIRLHNRFGYSKKLWRTWGCRGG
jgi:hypothetical protein